MRTEYIDTTAQYSVPIVQRAKFSSYIGMESSYYERYATEYDAITRSREDIAYTIFSAL